MEYKCTFVPDTHQKDLHNQKTNMDENQYSSSLLYPLVSSSQKQPKILTTINNKHDNGLNSEMLLKEIPAVLTEDCPDPQTKNFHWEETPDL